jgi:cell division control protein 6
MDHLVTKNQEAVYKLVEYANRPKSKLVLIGIANSLNLPDRFLPRLKVKGFDPQRLSFTPYSIKGIVEILGARLESVDSTSSAPIVEPQAIELCARKVSASCGDLRMALDMCRTAVELAEAEYLETNTRTPLQEMELQLLTPSSTPTKRRRMDSITESISTEVPTVTVQHIMTASQTMGSSHGFQRRLSSLPIHHKAILCTLAIMPTVDSTPTLGELCDKYTKLCRRDALIDVLPRGEFLDACEHLDSINAIAIEKRTGQKRTGRANGVGLGIQKADVLRIIAGIDILKKFFVD